MPDKARARYCLAALRATLGTIPDVSATEPDPPDFVIAHGGQRLGIEVTEFRLPPLPGQCPYQERQKLKERIVDRTEAIHAEAGGPGLYVDVFFRRYARRQTRHLAAREGLADADLRLHPPRSVAEPPI